MRHQGHSLIELLVVLGIVLVVCFSGAPAILSFQDAWTLHAEAAHFAALLEQARLQAVLTNVTVQVRAWDDHYSIRQSDGEPNSFLLTSGVRFDGLPKSVSFASHGTASPGITFTLVRKSRRTLVVVSPAGRVRVES
ncbi:MAG TPA: GspH/FimT family protein [Acidobacteriota bacterium]|jgi:Tfp pilus assembly protein FimT